MKTKQMLTASSMRYLTLYFATGRRQRFRVSSEEAERVDHDFQARFASAVTKNTDGLMSFTALGNETSAFRVDSIHGVSVRPLLVKSDGAGAGISLAQLCKVAGLAYQSVRLFAEKDKKGEKRLTWVSERKLELTRENLRFLGVPPESLEGLVARADGDES